MEFKGICKVVDKIVISDPSYGEDVWCRYERTDIGGKDWRVQGFIKGVSEEIECEGERFPVSGVEFVVGICAPGEHLILREDGSLLTNMSYQINEFVIGMDTACVGFGVNKQADDIKRCKGAWQPDCCLKTLTDGQFGNVVEGVFEDKVRFVVISGFLDEDTGYSLQDILDYLTSSLELELEPSLNIEDLISDAYKAEKEQFEGTSQAKADETLSKSSSRGEADKDADLER